MKDSMCKLYLVRHGETDWNKEHRVQGQQDIPLNSEGERQAYAVRNLFKDIVFDGVFSSDLVRAKRTAEIINLDHDLAVHTTKLLRERFLGRLEGKNGEELDKLEEETRDRFGIKQAEKVKRFKLYPEVENDEELIARVITALREIAVAHPGKTILIVSHGGVIRTLLVHLGFGTAEELPPFSLKNTGFIVLESDGVDFFIKETHGVEKVVLTD